MKQVFLFLPFIVTIFFPSCLSDMPDSISSDSGLNPSIAFPLGKTSVGLNSVSGFNEALLETNPLTNEPYWVEFEQIPLSYSMQFNMGDIYQNSEEVVELLFRLNIYNGFPADVQVQVYFLDYSGFATDSVFSDGPLGLNPATAKDNGEITSKPHEQKDILFNSERIDNLQFVDRVMVSVVFSTEGIDKDLVEYYDDYLVDVQIGVKANLKFGL